MSTVIGQVVRECRLDMVIGSGALGITLRAQHVRTGEVVAIKLLHSNLTGDGGFADRFRSVIQTAAGIRHDNILTIRDSGEQSGQFFIIMDFVAGGSVRRLLSRRDAKLQLRRALDLARQGADALAAGHARGVLHRDLKPENLLVEEGRGSDVVKLADFGLTRIAESGLTIEDAPALGSLPYMSPEQLRGLPVDARSDVYSLGVVLYEMVTGFPPFQVRNRAEALERHTLAPPPSPRSVVANLPGTLEALILRALDKDPAKRFQSANDLSVALQQEIERLPGKPLVEWRGPSAAPPRWSIAMKGAAAGGVAVPKTIPLAAVDDPETQFTAPPPSEPRSAPADNSRRIRVVPERETLSLVPGQQAVFTVTIMNSGRTVDHFTLSVRGVDESWVNTPQRPQQLNPGQRAVVPLSVIVPRVSASRADTYPVRVVARSRENPNEEGSAPATWTVQPFAETSLALFPPKARGTQRGGFTTTVRNQGNAKVRYSLSSEDDEKALEYRFDNSEFALEAGEVREVPLTTTARRRVIGSPHVYPFRVTSKSDAGGGAAEPPKSVGGQFVHRAIIPVWLPPMLVLGAVAAFMIFQWLKSNAQLHIAVLPAALQLSTGSSSPLDATVRNGKNEVVTETPVVWTSRDTTIATVSGTGVVTGLREGPTVVSASVGKVTQAVQVSVTAARVEVVTLAPKKVTIKVGQSAQLRATITDGNGNALQRDPLWQSSDPTVATVGGGRVTAKAPGSATITMQVESKIATADVVVPDTAGRSVGEEDCEAYDPTSLTLAEDKPNGWRVSAGQVVLATLDRKDEAQRVLSLAKRFKQHCFLGRGSTRPNPSVYRIEYWQVPTNMTSPIEKEECIAYDQSSLNKQNRGAAGFTLDAGTRTLLQADTQGDVDKAFRIAMAHKAFCTIGSRNRRPNRRDYTVQYWGR